MQSFTIIKADYTFQFPRSISKTSKTTTYALHHSKMCLDPTLCNFEVTYYKMLQFGYTIILSQQKKATTYEKHLLQDNYS